MHVLHVFRPAVPSMRAQVLQVVHTCHALAARGHDVTLLANPAPGAPRDATALLSAWGLDPVPGFHLRLAPTGWNPAASLWFRWTLGRWCDTAPRDSIAYVREARYLAVLGERPRVVYEAHCLERQRAAEEGEDAGPVEAMERAVLARAGALVTNSGGTLAALEGAYGAGWGGALPEIRRVIHNATRQDRVIHAAPVEPPIIAYTGSARAYKGVAALVEAMAAMPDVTLELIGEAPGFPLPPNVVSIPTVPYAELPARLGRCRALILPLEDNTFGRQFTSPLKLWDYLATGIPIVAADLPTVREIAGDLPFYYRPGDAVAMRGAVAAALESGPRPRRIRTWDDRAAELEAVLIEVLARPRIQALR